MKAATEQKPKFNDLADAGPVKTMLVIIWPLMMAIGAYWYCESREPNCQNSKEAAHEAKSQANNPGGLAFFCNSYSKEAEQKTIEGNAPIKCSIPCHIVNKALDDPVGLFTGFLVYVVYIQILLMFRQETWLRRSFKAAAASARAAIDGVNTAQDTAQRQLRAYVGIRPDPNYPPPTLDELHTKGFRFHVINYGQTPAHNVMHEIRMGGFTSEPAFEDIEFPQNGSRFVLHPNANSEINIARKNPFNEDEKTLIRKGKLWIYVWGEIRYQDAFDNGRRTKFRWKQSGSALQWTENGNEAT